MLIFCDVILNVLSSQSKRIPKLVFKTDYPLMQGKVLQNALLEHCKMLSWSILQYFLPSLSYHLRPLFYLFSSGRLKQVLLNFLINQSRKRELMALIQLYFGCLCSVSLLRRAVSWYMVNDCGIFWSY